MKFWIGMDRYGCELLIRENEFEAWQFIYGSDSWEPMELKEAKALKCEKILDSKQAVLSYQKEKKGYYEHLKELAFEVAQKAHKGQKDKGGRNYIEHPLCVSNSLCNLEFQIVALLHDVMEDSDYTKEDLNRLGFDQRIVEAVEVITKKKGQEYQDYLNQIKDNPAARMVKICDLKHNMDISRIENPCEKDFQRVEKYKNAMGFLNDLQKKGKK